MTTLGVNVGRSWEEHEWQTVAVTALPAGWRNVYDDDGELIVSACPCLLLQELRGTTRCTEFEFSTGRREVDRDGYAHEPPFDTRVVYAEAHAEPVVMPALDSSNYLGTVTPDGDPEHLRPRADDEGQP